MRVNVTVGVRVRVRARVRATDVLGAPQFVFMDSFDVAGFGGVKPGVKSCYIYISFVLLFFRYYRGQSARTHVPIRVVDTATLTQLSTLTITPPQLTLAHGHLKHNHGRSRSNLVASGCSCCRSVLHSRSRFWTPCHLLSSHTVCDEKNGTPIG